MLNACIRNGREAVMCFDEIDHGLTLSVLHCSHLVGVSSTDGSSTRPSCP